MESHHRRFIHEAPLILIPAFAVLTENLHRGGAERQTHAPSPESRTPPGQAGGAEEAPQGAGTSRRSPSSHLASFMVTASFQTS